MRCRHFCTFVSGARQNALGSLMPAWSALKSSLECIKEQPRALRHAPPANVQKFQQRIFAALNLVCSFFDYLFLQRFTLRSLFNNLFLQQFVLRQFLFRL